MKSEKNKTLLWVIFVIFALLLILVMAFPGDNGNVISPLRTVMRITFGLLGVIVATCTVISS